MQACHVVHWPEPSSAASFAFGLGFGAVCCVPRPWRRRRSGSGLLARAGRLGRGLRWGDRRCLLRRRHSVASGAGVGRHRGRLRGRVGLRLGGRGPPRNAEGKGESQNWHEEAQGGGEGGRPVAHEGRSHLLQALHRP